MMTKRHARTTCKNHLAQSFSFLILILLTTPTSGYFDLVPAAQCQPLSISKSLQGDKNAHPDLVNIDVVIYRKSDGQVVTDLKRENFAVFIDGVQKEITSFATPDRPVTVALLIEYSKMGSAAAENTSLGLGAISLSLVRPAGVLLTKLIKLPTDEASVIAFDLRPTSITNLTNDPRQIQEALTLLRRNTPALREIALFDALKFVLAGGRGDPAVLDKSKARYSDYRGLASVQGKRKAIVLIGSGLDSSSKTKLPQAREIIQDAGVPIFVIGTAAMFKADSGKLLSSKDQDELTKAEAQLNAIAQETGGKFYPYDLESDGPEILERIKAAMSGQYGLTFKPDVTHDGKAHKIVVKVDVDLDGNYEEQTFLVQARQVYNAPKK